MQETWSSTLSELKSYLSNTNYETWFKHVDIFCLENNTLILTVPNRYVMDWIQTKYATLLLQILSKKNEKISKIEFRILKISDLPGPILYDVLFTSQKLEKELDQMLNVIGEINQNCEKIQEIQEKNSGQFKKTTTIGLVIIILLTFIIIFLSTIIFFS